MLIMQDVPVLLRPDGYLQLVEDLTRDTRWGRFVVPRGFRTDVASVPSFMRWLTPHFGRLVNLAAILHDWCCEHLESRLLEGRTLDDRDPDGPLVGPRNTDVLFRETLRDAGMPTLLRWTYWSGVRWGALGSAYRRPGWLADLPLLLLVTLLVAPVVLPTGLVVMVGLAVYVAAEAVVDWTARMLRPRRRT